MSTAYAKLMAVLGLDASGFRREMDGSARKIKSFGASLQSINRIAKISFAVGVVRSFGNAISDIERLKSEKGIELVDEEQLARIKSAQGELEKIGATLRAKVAVALSSAVAGWKAFWAAMGARSGGASWKEAWEIAGDAMARAEDAMKPTADAADRIADAAERESRAVKDTKRLREDIASINKDIMTEGETSEQRADRLLGELKAASAARDAGPDKSATPEEQAKQAAELELTEARAARAYQLAYQDVLKDRKEAADDEEKAIEDRAQEFAEEHAKRRQDVQSAKEAIANFRAGDVKTIDPLQAIGGSLTRNANIAGRMRQSEAAPIVAELQKILATAEQQLSALTGGF